MLHKAVKGQAGWKAFAPTRFTFRLSRSFDRSIHHLSYYC